MLNTRATRRRKPTGRVLGIVAGTLAALVAPLAMSITDLADADTVGSPDPVVTATIGSQTNVAPNTTPLTGLVDGSSISITATSPGNLAGVDARQCRNIQNIQFQASFNPTQGGNCVDVPISANSDDYVSSQTAPPNNTTTFPFRVGTGTRTVSFGSGQSRVITCDGANDCTLWLKVSVFSGGDSAGAVWKHYNLEFAGAPSAPQNVAATPGNGSASVTFTAPADNGNAPITSYTATATPQGGGAPVSQSGAASPIALSGLTNGTTYNVTVTATNTAVDGTTHFTSAPSSPAATVTPAAPPPAVTSISPTSGPTAGGTSVTITGSGLGAATSVTFGGTAATIGTNTATQITATAPAHVAGVVDVRVSNVNGTSANTNADNYTYVAPAPPAITSVSPTSGPTAGGNNVTINGTGLSGATGVSFGGTPAGSITTNSATQIVVVAPAHAAGAVDIRVTNANGSSANTNADNYTFVAPAPPAITSITPKTGPPAGGTSVTITGTALSGATSVKFGGVPGTITSNTATKIVVTAPAHAAGTVDIVVTNAIGSSANSAADDFTYAEPSGDPVGGLLAQLVATVQKALNSLACALNPAACG